MNLGQGILALVGLVVIVCGVFSVVVAFIPARHPETEERFGSRRRLERELKDRRKFQSHW